MPAIKVLLRFLLPLFLLAVAGFAVAQPASTPHSSQALTVWASGGLRPVLKAIDADFTRQTGIKIKLEAAPSMGTTAASIPERLAHHDTADVLVMVEAAIAPLARHHWVDPQQELMLADSRIGVAVPAGSALSSVATTAQLRQALRNARHIAYSDSASGLYVASRLFSRLGMAQAVKGKAFRVDGTPVGLIVKQGKADLGFQQLSELEAISGIKVIGPLPEALEKITRYAAVPVKGNRHPTATRQYLAYLATRKVARVIRAYHMSALQGHSQPINTAHVVYPVTAATW